LSYAPRVGADDCTCPGPPDHGKQRLAVSHLTELSLQRRLDRIDSGTGEELAPQAQRHAEKKYLSRIARFSTVEVGERGVDPVFFTCAR